MVIVETLDDGRDHSFKVFKATAPNASYAVAIAGLAEWSGGMVQAEIDRKQRREQENCGEGKKTV